MTSKLAPPPQYSCLSTDSRGVSTAVTHVLAIGITTILISGLLIASAGLLTGQQDNAGRTELQEIGNRIAEQMYLASTNVDGSSDSVSIRLNQPPRVAGYSYTVTKVGASQCSGGIVGPPSGSPDRCLKLDTGPGLNIQPVYVPVELEDGGSYTISIENRGSGEFVITVQP